MLVLIKILTWMASPIGFMLWGSVLGYIFLWSTQWKKFGRFVISLAIIQLAIFSSPVVSQALLGRLEDQARALENTHQQKRGADEDSYFAIMLLGGATVPANPPKRLYPDLNGNADRIWHAARLYKQGLAPKIIITGHHLPGFESRNDIQSEAQAMRMVLVDFGIPESAMILEESARTTRENVTKTKMLVGQKRIALVTSAFHMPRSVANFRKEGVRVEAFPTDFKVDAAVSVWYDRVLPNPASLGESQVAIREYIALLIGY